MCINPMHYNILEAAAVNKSPVSARKSPLKPKSNNKMPSSNQLHDQEPPEDSDSDFLSDDSDEGDSVDWVEKWRTEFILPDVTGPQKVGIFPGIYIMQNTMVGRGG